MRLIRSTSTHFFVIGIALVLLLAWDAAGLDLVLARAVGTDHGFPLKNHWVLNAVLHDAARWTAGLIFAWLALGIVWPTGILKRLPRWQRVQWVVTTLLGLALISLLKLASQTSCPWDLAEFGGRAIWVSHWAWNSADGGSGHCFPAGHASTGFAFIGGYFALRRRLPRAARIWLAGALAAGLLLGVSQQLRGAHFMSHTLWTAWLCGATGWLIDLIWHWAQSLPPRVAAETQPISPALPQAQAPAV